MKNQKPNQSNFRDYAITRAIRFKLKQTNNALNEEITQCKNAITIFEGDKYQDVKNLKNQMEVVYRSTLQYFLRNSGKESNDDVENIAKTMQLTQKVLVKTSWLKQYTKAEFFEQPTSQREREHPLNSIFYLPQKISQWSDKWKEIIEELNKLNDRPEEKLPRRAEYAALIQKIRTRDCFPLIKDFVALSRHKSDDTTRNVLLSEIKKLQEILTSCEALYSTAQSSGICIARASLNFYVVNKAPRDFSSERQKLEEQLTDIAIKTVDENPEQLIKKYLNPSYTRKTSTLEKTITEIKEGKAAKKQAFDEAMAEGLSYQQLKKDHPLFDCKESHFNVYAAQIKQIQLLGEKINQAKQDNQHDEVKKLKDKIKSIKQESGRYFLQTINVKPPREYSKWYEALKNEKVDSGKINGGKVGAKEYKLLCTAYRTLAQKRGKIIAQLRGIEKEEIDSQLLNYWALFAIQNNQYQLVLIPKRHASKAYNFLDSQINECENYGAQGVTYFKSLTLRALDKLCFTADGSFQQDLKNKGVIKDRAQGKFSYDNKTELIAFYQNVLQLQIKGQGTIDVQDFDGLESICKKNYGDDLNAFEKELEQCCYIARQLHIDHLNELRAEYDAQILTLDNYDFNRDNPRKGDDGILRGNEKAHTQLWQRLWSAENQSNHYNTRINPELRIYWREPKESRVEKYGKDSSRYDSNKNNRYLQEQLTLATTITDHANGERSDIGFSKIDYIANNIKQFNHTYYQRHIKDNLDNVYYLGIDRGQQELATSAVVSQFSETGSGNDKKITGHLTPFTIYRLRNESLDYSEPYTTKSGEEKQRRAIVNLSYFTNREDVFEKLFEKAQVNSIDLTSAKMIKGKLVENGDMMTYLQLKRLNARRRLYLQFSTANIVDVDNPIFYDESENVFRIKQQRPDDYGDAIYYFKSDLASVLPKETVAQELNKYLQELKQKNRYSDELTIEKINHLRDAISANMVGVMMHLIKQLQQASPTTTIVTLEDLNESILKKHFHQNFENIGRRLEWRLYNRLQREGLVPPSLKETVLLREGKSAVKQFGAMVYIKEDHTSKECPNCNQNVIKGKDKDESVKFEKLFNENKFKHHKFVCPHCKFEASQNKQDMGLRSPDDVACYNISKRGFEFCKNPPTFTTSQQKSTSNYGQEKKYDNKRTDKPPHPKRENKPATHKGLAELKNLLLNKDKKS